MRHVANLSNDRAKVALPSLHFEVLAIRGQKNILPHPIYLPPLLMSEAKIVGGNEDVSLRIPGFEGFEMIVKANSVTFPDGSKVGPLVVSPVHADRLPMVPPGGSATFMAPAWTIQPTGTRFDPPMEVRIPNSGGLKPGETSEIYQWDHDLGTFVPMGRATVSEDGALLVTDGGFGVTKAGWGGNPPIPPPPPNCATPQDDCKDCRVWNGSSNVCKCAPDFSQDGNACAQCKQCLGGVCMNNFQPIKCSDQKYCTENDRCVQGNCKADEVKDIRKGATTWNGVLATPWEGLTPTGGIGGAIRSVLARLNIVPEGEVEEIDKCCEPRKGARVPEVKASATVKAEVPWGPIPTPLSIPIPVIDTYIGLVIQGNASLGGSITYVSNFCEDKERCEQEVQVKLEVEGEAFLGAVAGAREDVLEIGAFGKTGLEGTYTEDPSGSGKVEGQWKGLTAGFRVVLLNGFISVESERQILQPAYTPQYPVSGTGLLQQIPGFKPCK